jgi:hypothetical protein
MLKQSRSVPRFENCDSCGCDLDEAVGESEKELSIVCLRDGTIRFAEVHWYEAHGIGKVRMKIKRYLD